MCRRPHRIQDRDDSGFHQVLAVEMVRRAWILDIFEGIYTTGLSDELDVGEGGRRKTWRLKLEHGIKVTQRIG